MHLNIRDFWTRTSLLASSLSHHTHDHESSSVSTVSSELTTVVTISYVSTVETTVYTETPSSPFFTSIPSTDYKSYSSSASPTETESSSTDSAQIATKTKPAKTESCKTCTATTTMSTILSTLTLSSTLYVTLSTALSPVPTDIPSAIRSLSECTQDVLFPLLGNSQCNPTDFTCICSELDRLDALKEVSDECPEDAAQYNEFAVHACGKIAGVATITSSYEVGVTTATVLSTSSPESSVKTDTSPKSGVTTATIPVIILSTGSPVEATSSGPFNNGTIIKPTKSKTEIIVLPTETSKGNGTGGGGSGGSGSGGSGSGGSGSGGSGSGGSGSGGSGSGEGSGSSPTQPESPEFSGAAVSEFGNGKMATFAGFMGIMWLAFAEL